jgi:hypothetical protein
LWLIVRFDSTADPFIHSQLISSWCQLLHSTLIRIPLVWNDRGWSSSWRNCEIEQSKWYFGVDEFTCDANVLSFSIPSRWICPDLQPISHGIQVLTRGGFFDQCLLVNVMKWTLSSNDQYNSAFHSISDNHESYSNSSSS